jgi:energy-converting hydrogenase A subunit M
MSKFEKELRRRLASGDDVEETACWYIDCMAVGKVQNSDLTPFELKFWKQIVAAFIRWKAIHRPPSKLH